MDTIVIHSFYIYITLPHGEVCETTAENAAMAHKLDGIDATWGGARGKWLALVDFTWFNMVWYGLYTIWFWYDMI